MTEKFLPYGRQAITEEDIASVTRTLRSDFLTTGPLGAVFEQAVADFVHSPHAVAVANGTAALHAAMHAAGIMEGDEVIVPTMTFAATANAVVFQGGTPVFADVEESTLLLDPGKVEEKISSRTRAIVAVDYCGQPCDYELLREIVNRHRLVLIADACHSLGASFKGKPCGNLADLTAFSFHPVKPITTGEGGMVTTASLEYDRKIRMFRNHGITSDHHQRQKKGTWFYEMEELGYNYRLSDIQCALGISQLTQLPDRIKRRREIAAAYNSAFVETPEIRPLSIMPDTVHGYHLYVVRLDPARRDAIFTTLHNRGIGTAVHYIPVHLHPYYQKHFNTSTGLCPVAESAYHEILSLPIFPAMTDSDVNRVIDELKKAVK